MFLRIMRSFTLAAAWAASLFAQNPAMNSNAAWQMQQMQFDAQRMFHMQQQLHRTMQTQIGLMRMQAEHLQRMQQQSQAAAAHLRQANQLEGAVRKAAELPAAVLAKPTGEAWKVELGESKAMPSYDGIRMIGVHDPDYSIRCLDVTTGKLIWTHAVKGTLAQDPVLIGDLALYMNENYLLTLLESATGKVRHEIQLEKLGKFLFSDKKMLPKLLYPTRRENSIFLSIFGKGKKGATGIVYSIDVVKGTKQWETTIPGGSDLTPTLLNDRILVGGETCIMALSLETGKSLWQFDVPPEKVINRIRDGILLGDQFHVVLDEQLLAIDAKTGKEAWRVPYPSRGMLTGEGDRLVYAEKRGLLEKGWIVSRDLKSGEKVWESLIGETGLPWIHDRKVICISNEDLLALDLKTGKQIWKVGLASKHIFQFILSGDAAYMFLGAKNYFRIQAIRLSDGTKAWEYPVTDKRSFDLVLPMADGLLFPGEKGYQIALK